MYSVIGETLLSTTTTVPPAGRELICLYMPPLSVCGEHWEHVYAHNHWTSSTPLPWLLVLSNKPPPHLRRQEATAKLLTKVQANDKLLLNTDIKLYPAARLSSRKPVWLDPPPEDMTANSAWSDEWAATEVVNHSLVAEPWFVLSTHSPFSTTDQC